MATTEPTSVPSHDAVSFTQMVLLGAMLFSVSFGIGTAIIQHDRKRQETEEAIRNSLRAVKR